MAARRDYTVAQVAQLFKVSEFTIKRGIKAGVLRTYRLDQDHLILGEDVEALGAAVAKERQLCSIKTHRH